MKKQVVVIGLGRFGSSVASELYQLGHDVLAIDLDEKLVQDMQGHVTYAVRADSTGESVLEDLGVPNFDVAIVSIGTDIQASILITVLLKSLGLPFIIARAGTEPHGNALERIGADRVVYPEYELGKSVAHKLFNPGVLDYMEVSSNFHISKVRPPEHLIHHTVEDAGLRSPRDKYGVAVLAIKRGREHILIPARDEEIRPGDLLIVAGESDQLDKLQEPLKESVK